MKKLKCTRQFSRWLIALRPICDSTRRNPIVFFLGLLALCGWAFGEDIPKPRIAVVRFANETGVSSYDAACKAATDTLLLTLTQLGRYRIQSEEGSGGGEDALRALAEEEQLDFIVYGSMSKSGSGGIDCVLSVFDRAKGKTALSQSRKAAGVLDIFDTTDDLVVSVLESMTGAHIGFGSLALTNTGEKGSYTVLVDGAEAGKDLTSLEKVLNGRRTVAIVQKRMLGDREIARSAVDVKEGETAEFGFAIPLLMDDEKLKVEGLRADIAAEWDDATAAGDVEAKTAELLSLFGDVSYSPKLSPYRDEATELAGEWVLKKARLAIEESAWEPKVELLDAAGAVYAGAKAYPDPERIRKEFEEEALLVETLFALEAGNALAGGELAAGLVCFGNALMVSTRYLGGKRMTDYAYAMTVLQSLQEEAGAAASSLQGDKDLKTVFGEAMGAGKRFYGLKDAVAGGKAIALVASDFTKPLSVDGGEYAQAPIAVEPAAGTRTLSVQAKGGEKPIAVTSSAKARLLFVQDGFAAFGKVALGAAPGAIEVSVDLESSSFGQEGFPTSAEASPMVSLDGGDEVAVPHVFENISAGRHAIRIPNVRAGSKLYVGLEENVTVEPGKRLIFKRALPVGQSKIHVDGIPDGAKLFIDGDEQILAGNPAGGMLFDGTVNAGYPRLDVISGNKDWYSIPYVAIDNTNIRAFSVKNMALQVTLQQKSINLKKGDKDWADIEPAFYNMELPFGKKIPGSIISSGCVCRDEQNLYIKIDFSNGTPVFLVSDRSSDRMLQLTENKTPYQVVNLQLHGGKDGIERSAVWLQSAQTQIEEGSYSIGPSFIELSFPLSSISKYFDFSKPIRAKLQSQLNDPYMLLSYSPYINIVVADKNQARSGSTKSRGNSASQILLQWKTINIKGEGKGWADILPIFNSVEGPNPSKLPGSIISGGSICRDKKNLYIKIDFSNGTPVLIKSDRSSDRLLQLAENKAPYQVVELQLDGGRDGVWRSSMWVQSTNVWTEAGSYTLGPSYIELSFPFSLISKYFDFSKPIRARLHSQLNDPFSLLSYSPDINIILGE
jgi:TolB-like protein